MRLVAYAPEHFDALARAAARLERGSSLLHRGFVDHYYAASPYCRLHLALGDDGEVLGSVGVEQMRFEADPGALVLGFGSNFNAFQPGVGGLLYLQWLKTCPAGIIFGSSEEAQRIYRHEGWTFYPPVPVYELNPALPPRSGEGPLRRLAKAVLRRVRRAPIPAWAPRLADTARSLSVREEGAYSDDLLPRRSPFAFRFAPTKDQLAWRYALGLSFTRYRLFRILRGDASLGYVVLNETADRLLVSHCDGEDAASLAHGILLAVLAAGKNDTAARSVVLCATHPAMRSVFEAFGFRRTAERPFAVGSLKARPELGDSAAWLVSFDWGDNGLRPPFADQPRS